MEKELVRMHLKEIARAEAYVDKGKSKMAEAVLASSLGTLERKMRMDGECTAMAAELYVCVFTSYLQVLIEAETGEETDEKIDAAFADSLSFLEAMPENQHALWARCYLSVLCFLRNACFAHLRKSAQEDIGQISYLIDEAAKQDALDETALWGEFYACAALFSSRYALCSSDEVNVLYDKAALYLDTYGYTGSVTAKAFSCGVRRRICMGKMLYYLRREQYGRAWSMFLGALKAQMLEKAFQMAELVTKLIARFV